MTRDQEPDFILSDNVARGVEWRPDKTVFGAYFRELEVKTVWARVLDINPGEAAVLVRNGRVDEIITQERLRLGGWWSNLKTSVGLPSNLSVLMLDTTRLELELAFARDNDRFIEAQDVEFTYRRPPLYTRDNLYLPARVTAWASVSLEDLKTRPFVVQALLGLFKGQRFLRHVQVAQLITDSALGNFLMRRVSEHTADEIEENEALEDELVDQAKAAVAGSMQPFGLWLDNLKIVWGRNALQLERLDARASEIRNLGLEREHRAKLEEIRRGGDERVQRIDGDLSIDLRQQTHRREQERDDSDLQRDLDSKERAAALESQKAADRHAFELEGARAALDLQRLSREQELAMGMLEKQKDLKLQERRLELEQRNLVADSQQRMTTALLQAAAQTGNLTPEMIGALMQQSTLQSAAVLGAEEAKAVAEGISSRRELEAYRAGQKEDRAFQSSVLQGVGSIAQGFRPAGFVGFGAQPVLPTPTVPIASVSVPPAGLLPAATQRTCSGCAATLEPAWKACPQCGMAYKPPAASSGCGSCGVALQPGWKACSECGTAVTPAKRTCASCGMEAAPTWKACPGCGGRLG